MCPYAEASEALCVRLRERLFFSNIGSASNWGRVMTIAWSLHFPNPSVLLNCVGFLVGETACLCRHRSPEIIMFSIGDVQYRVTCIVRRITLQF